MRLWGLPLPFRWRPSEPLDVAVATGSTPPRTAGVRGRRIAPGRAVEERVDGAAVVDPIAALFLCAPELEDRALTVALEAAIATASCYPGLRPDRPPATLDSIERRLSEWGRFPGCARVRAQLPHTRSGAESPKETETRLLLTGAGLPEPMIQYVVSAHGRFVARVDLAYPQWRVAIEYEGDGNRTDRDQWRVDIRRQRDLEDLGWIVIRVTELDLRDGGRSLVARIRRATSTR